MIAQLRARQSELEALANYDCLTGLASRRLLNDRFQCAVERAKRNDTSFAVFVIDLDGFKQINDSHGHAVGDAVLVEVSRRIAAVVRTCDTAARFGGDEFVLIVEGLTALCAARVIHKKIQAAVRASIDLGDGRTLSVGASVGHSIYPQDGLDMDRMLQMADQFMYASKAISQAVWTGRAPANTDVARTVPP